MGFHCFVLPLRFNVDFRPGIKVSFVSLSIFSLTVSCGKTLIFNKHFKHNRITSINMNGQAFKYTDIRDILKKQNACVLITQELKSI